MNNKAKRITAIILGITLVGGSVGATVFASAATKAAEGDTVVALDETAKDDKVSATDSENDIKITKKEKSEDAIEKEETVYVFANSDGSVKNIIVSDWLKNATSEASIKDISNLTDIENVKSDETFSTEGELGKTWNANGNDIYYRGNANNSLPVNMKVSYKLDGNEISASELAGKSGKVTMRYDYENTVYEEVEIDGKKEKIYVPFAMVTGMVLDTDSFRNIKVTNGKLVNDGDNTVVVGIAFPGMQESLGIDSDKFEIPSFFEVTADVTDFSLTTTYSFATSEIFNEYDVEGIDSLNDLSDGVSELDDAMDKLLDGSDKLYDGLTELLDKSGDLVDGIDALYDGGVALKNGAASLATGAKDLDDGADKLETGAKDLKDGAKTLKTGAKDLKDGANTLNTGASTLSSGLAQLSENNDSLNAGALKVFETLLKTATTQIKAAGVECPDLTVENYSTVIDGILAAGEKQIKNLVASGASSEVIAAASKKAKESADSLNALKKSLDDYNTFYVGLTTYTAGVKSASDGANTLAEGTKALAEGATSLSDGTVTLYNGTKTLSKGASDLAEGTDALKNGATELKNGASDLSDGIGKLKESAPKLVNGIKKLKNGSKKLYDGLVKFDEEGIQKLVDAVDGDLTNLTDRIDAIKNVAGTYNNYSGIADGMEGSVKFVYRTDAIEIDE